LLASFKEYKNIKDAAGNPLLQDAGDCAGATDPRRSVAFERLLLAAPRVDSRYTDDMSGVIIAEHSVYRSVWYSRLTIFNYKNANDITS
jgi:hypothetical protein